MIKQKDIIKKPLFAISFAFLAAWLVLYRTQTWTNLESLSANWLAISVGGLAIALVASVLIREEMAKGKKKSVAVIV